MSTAVLFGCYFIFILLFAVFVCWLWPDFVDTATTNSEFKRVRRTLYAFLCVQLVAEICIWMSGVVRSWMLIVVMITNAWGMLDAFLRYPLVHDIDSIFGLKQVLMITARVCLYALGFRSIAKNAGWFVLLLLTCVFTLPILWLTALPIGDSSCYHMKHGVVDKDIAVRIWSMVSTPAERKELLVRIRVLTRSTVVELARVAPWLKPTLVSWDPSLARVLGTKPVV
mmetsp:Transcript_35683/g.65450  ORF Transcript_35683/g.65450 Transcript_35683/m.65450 type:complete len:226 (-) Transcript_35683:92-769(-)